MINSIFDILTELCEKHDIIGLNFHSFPTTNSLQERINASEVEERQINAALKIRDHYKLPFWDSLLLTYFNNPNPSPKILNEVLTHNQRDDIKEISILDYEAFTIFFNSSLTSNMALNSKVLLKDGQIRHIPLIDFHIPVSLKNEDLIGKIINLLGFKSGYLLNSGKSYHFYGSDNLLSEGELITFLSRSLLFSPIIDKAWIAHQLIERSCSLRISLKNDKLPELIRVIK